MPSAAEISRRLHSAPPPPVRTDYSDINVPKGFFTEPAKPAAVLIPLFAHEGSWQVLFTRRNANLPEHSGQVAFPGGRADETDRSAKETALRETYEEIGLPPQKVRLLGQLNEFTTITNYRITPVVGIIPWPYDFVLEDHEVSRIFSIPLQWLSDPAHHEKRFRTISNDLPPLPVYYFEPYDGEILWGVSAQLMLRFIEVMNSE